MKLNQIVYAMFVAIMVLAGTVRAQDTALSGSVTDATDAALPGVTVTALHVATGNTFVAVSDTSGAYRIGAMRPGVYKVTAELPGFTIVTRENVELLVGQNIVFNVKMTLATVTTVRLRGLPITYRPCKKKFTAMSTQMDSPILPQGIGLEKTRSHARK